ncbi:hypothetical protein M569_14160 [Genlisea aurea]|uniref:Uncharacterized protein n=1 Tax=Genlisea aurea TaxID=192259 RepID=S8DM04_9LAMI|nr:hypothetical protein M569_14160 [Genlisea aurea]
MGTKQGLIGSPHLRAPPGSRTLPLVGGPPKTGRCRPLRGAAPVAISRAGRTVGPQCEHG